MNEMRVDETRNATTSLKAFRVGVNDFVTFSLSLDPPHRKERMEC